jgi:hypothetical protein
MIDSSSNPLLISAGITTSITCAISGYALYELLSVGPEETDTARIINPQLRRQPISSNIVPNVSAPQSWSVRPGKRPEFMPITSNTPSTEVAVAQTLISLWKNGKLPLHLAPLVQQVESGIDEFQAKGYLEAARIQATQQDYAKALKYLKEIPSETSVHPQAQLKIAEYTEKQTLQATAWMRKANALAQLKNFSGARIYLKQVPDTTPVYPTAQNKMTEYAQTQNVQANFWFEEASKLANQGKLSDAITYLKRIPLGTSIYTVAQNKITEYSQKSQLKAANPQPTPVIVTPAKPPKPTTAIVSKPPKPETQTTTPTPTPQPTSATEVTPSVTPSAVATPNPTSATEVTPSAVATPNPTSATEVTPSAVATPNPTSATEVTPSAVATPNPTSATEVTPSVTPSAVATPNPTSATEVTPSSPPSPPSPSQSATSRAASVTTATPEISVESVNPTPERGENSIVQPQSSTDSSNPQISNSPTVQTPARVSTSVQPRPQIRPETLQTPTFIRKQNLPSSPKVEQPSIVSPATSSLKNNLKQEQPNAITPVNPASSVAPQLKKAPSDTDPIWNSESFTDNTR